MQSSGPLADFVDLQTALAWQLLRQMPRPPQVTQQQFVKASAPIPLNAFENYIRGVTATSRQLKIRYFKEAIRLNPNYSLAELQLGKVYYENHEYEQAAVVARQSTEGRLRSLGRRRFFWACRSITAETSTARTPHSVISRPDCR